MDAQTEFPTKPTIAAQDEAYELVPGDPLSGFLVVCDHASNRLPDEYGTLGLPSAQLKRHIGYDIGSATLTRTLAAELNAPAVLSRFSRLLIDPNRDLDDPTLIMKLSDGAVVPENANISEPEKNKRIDTYYAPYHDAIDNLIDDALSKKCVPAILSIHSFTNMWGDSPRPWHVAVLWDKDDRLSKPLIESLRKDETLIIGDNEPYTGQLKGDCMNKHGTVRGVPHVLIEIRQDLITKEEEQRKWGKKLAHHITEIMRDEDLAKTVRQIRQYGSNSD